MAASSDRPHALVTLAKLVGILLAAGVLASGLVLPYVGGLGLAAGHEAKEFLGTTCKLQEAKPPRPTTLYARDGKTVIARLFTQDRKPIPLSQVPDYLQKALIATEDRRFYEHQGVDMRGLIRAALSTSSGDTQGGSTLTMQYVKQVRYYQAVEAGDTEAAQAAIAVDLHRKMEDAQCALYLENVKNESKQTILKNYLNIAFFGENAYGIESAAQTYFGKHTRELTLPESAMLVGLLRAPSAYDPFEHPKAATVRRNEVLQNLVAVGELSQAKANQYKRTPISLATKHAPSVKEGCANSPTSIKNIGFFCTYAKNWLNNVEKIKDLDTGGYEIVTTLDPDVQNSAQKGVSKAIPASSPTTAILPVVDPKTGDVLAMASSKLFGTNEPGTKPTHTMLPIFTQNSGQGASTWKLFPLLTALSTGIPKDWPLETDDGYKPMNCLSNAPVQNNAAESYDRNETLTSATVKSSNTFFVGMADQLFGCHLQPIIDMAKKLGMGSLGQQQPQNPKLTVSQSILKYQQATRLTLGDIGTSPLAITSAYAAIANDGKYNQPAPIISIKDSSGKSIPVERSPGVQVVYPQVARKAVDVLTGDTVQPGTSADVFESWYDEHSSEVAGKTGTATAVNPRTGKSTDKNATLWFVGMTPDLVATSELVNLHDPNAPMSGLPGVKHPAKNAYGAYAAGVWLDALEPIIGKQQWSWPTAGSVPGSHVPNIVGMTVDEAKAALKKHGYKMTRLGGENNLLCASSQLYGQVAFYAPQQAPKGSTITVCPSNGSTQDVWVPPPPPPPPPPEPEHDTPSGGNNNGNDHGGESGQSRGGNQDGGGNDNHDGGGNGDGGQDGGDTGSGDGGQGGGRGGNDGQSSDGGGQGGGSPGGPGGGQGGPGGGSRD